MRHKVQLYVAGKVFDEYVEARDYQEARQVALARNPNADVISVTAVFDNGGYQSSSADVYEAPEQTYHSSDTSGLGGLVVLGIAGWLMWEAWKLSSAIIIAIWQWIVGSWQWFMGLFSFMSPQLLVGLVLGFFFLVLVIGALDE